MCGSVCFPTYSLYVLLFFEYWYVFVCMYVLHVLSICILFVLRFC